MATSRNNARKRGSTWTYYADGTGERRQRSKGGFATREKAEAAKVEALAELSNGNWVQPDRLTVAELLTDEWRPTQRPPTLEESTYASYARNIRLHVVPYVGAIRLQQLTPMDLNAPLPDAPRLGPTTAGLPVRRHDPAVLGRIARLKARGTGGSR